MSLGFSTRRLSPGWQVGVVFSFCSLRPSGTHKKVTRRCGICFWTSCSSREAAFWPLAERRGGAGAEGPGQSVICVPSPQPVGLSRPCVLIAHGFCVVTARLAGSGQIMAGPLIFGKMLLLQTAYGPTLQRGLGSDVGILLTQEGTPSCHHRKSKAGAVL